MDIVERAKREADLILPKLRHVRNRGDGAIIHDVIGHIALVSNYREMLNRPGRSDPATLAEELCDCVRKAEQFLCRLVL